MKRRAVRQDHENACHLKQTQQEEGSKDVSAGSVKRTRYGKCRDRGKDHDSEVKHILDKQAAAGFIPGISG